MRSYYEHLKTAAGMTTAVIPPHPTTRSSAIFPVINLPGISSRILFMGYWILKRNIKEILAVINLRSEKGSLLGRQTFTIDQPKSFKLELKDQLVHAGIDPEGPFTGSMEVEFFSTVNLVFPFPAVVINYYGPSFSTVVHTAQRIYNDFEDRKRNSQSQVPESGFNIYADEEREPFIGLINGAEAIDNEEISLEFYNAENQILKVKQSLGRMDPYETRFLYPAREHDLKTFLHGEAGSAKAFFYVAWIFPRLLVGNIQKNLPAITLTHTYYDCSSATADSDYWRAPEPHWHEASLMVPAAIINDHYTNINFYPIYSPASFAIDLEFYSYDGKFLGSQADALTIELSSPAFKSIKLKQLMQKLGCPTDINAGARIIARSQTNSRIPARIKIGLDVGNDPKQLPCNICTNLQPFNPALDVKPTSFRWGPVLADQPAASVWVMNSAPHITYTRSAQIDITFYREQDAQSIARTYIIQPHGFQIIYPNQDPELREFFGGKIGWYTATTSNPYTSTYYFAENPSGIVGGDHGF